MTQRKASRAASAAPTSELVPRDYAHLLADIKERVRSARVRAGFAVNRELVLVYWHIGRRILQSQRREGWGTRVVERLAEDLGRAFPDMRGFSTRNLKYMRAFAEAWPDEPFVQQLAAQIPWFHNCVLLDQVSEQAQREWYVRATIEHGWSRNVLVHQIESDLYGRKGKALSNFDRLLPAPQSELAGQVMKDPYNLDFLGLSEEVAERELERSLLEHLEKFLLELGVGFAFVGRQYHMEVGGQDFYIDLLFYHVRLHRYVVIELKTEEFKPEFAGKMGFYLAAVDDNLRKTPDEPSVGIILCKSRNRVIVEYALRYADKPMGVATYRLAPQEMRQALPTPEVLRAALKEYGTRASLSFGDRLRELRKAMGLTQKDLAVKVGIDFTYLSKIETGGADPPSEDTIRDLARVLKTDPESLIFLAGKVPKDIGKVVTKSAAATMLMRGMKDKEFTEEELAQCLRELKEKRKGAD